MFVFVLTYFVIPVISISIFLVFIRLLKGPTIEDRVVAFDLLSSIAIGFLSVYAVITFSTAILDVGIIIALIVFLGTVAFAYYLERRTRK
jgi:multicomponent Na+:H+ antiporter subunit F